MIRLLFVAVLGLSVFNGAMAGTPPTRAGDADTVMLLRVIDDWQAQVFRTFPASAFSMASSGASSPHGDERWLSLRRDSRAAIEKAYRKGRGANLCRDRLCDAEYGELANRERAAQMLANDLARRLANPLAAAHLEPLRGDGLACASAPSGQDDLLVRACAYRLMMTLDFDAADALFADGLKRPDARYDLLLDYGIFLHRQGRLESARSALQRSLAIGRATHDDIRIATALQHLANVVADMQLLDEAAVFYAEALKIRRHLVVATDSASVLDLATTLNNYATVLQEQYDAAAAVPMLRESLQLRLALAGRHPDNYLPNVAVTLNNIGDLLVFQGRQDAARQAREHDVAVYRLLAAREAAMYEPQLGAALTSLAAMCATQQRWQCAADAAEAGANVYRGLIRADREVHAELAGALLMLGNAQEFMRRPGAAGDAVEEAVGILRLLGTRHAAGIRGRLAGALVSLGRQRLAQGRLTEAAKAWGEVAALAAGALRIEAASRLKDLLDRLERFPAADSRPAI